MDSSTLEFFKALAESDSGKAASVSKIENPTLGDLIRCTREDADLSRAQVARRTGISENSFAKYEKAGSPEGQYPSAQKLAVICSVLEIDPAFALVYSMTEEQKDQHGQYLIRYGILDEVPMLMMRELAPDLKIDRRELMLRVMMELIQLRAENEDLRSQIENGPDQEGPSRSKTHTTDEKAVGAASTKPKKDRIDEAD